MSGKRRRQDDTPIEEAASSSKRPATAAPATGYLMLRAVRTNAAAAAATAAPGTPVVNGATHTLGLQLNVLTDGVDGETQACVNMSVNTFPVKEHLNGNAPLLISNGGQPGIVWKVNPPQDCMVAQNQYLTYCGNEGSAASPTPDTPSKKKQKFERRPILKKYGLESSGGASLVFGSDPVHLCVLPETVSAEQAENDLTALQRALHDKVLVRELYKINLPRF